MLPLTIAVPYQIGHHSFPSMPRPSMRRAQPLVAAFCADRDVSYTEDQPARVLCPGAWPLRRRRQWAGQSGNGEQGRAGARTALTVQHASAGFWPGASESGILAPQESEQVADGDISVG